MKELGSEADGMNDKQKIRIARRPVAEDRKVVARQARRGWGDSAGQSIVRRSGAVSLPSGDCLARFARAICQSDLEIFEWCICAIVGGVKAVCGSGYLKHWLMMQTMSLP